MQRDVGGCRWQRAHGHGFPSEAPTGETDLESFDAPTAVAPGTLMTGAHSPWPLFCNDLDQAQQWVSDQLARSPTDTKLGHQALSLGLNDAVRQLLNQGNLNLEDATQRQWKFRLARLSGAKNPYAELIPPDVQTFTDLQMDHAKRMGVPAVVSLLGGIGDHLEIISMLLEWSRIDAHPLILQVTPQRQQALAPLIESIPQLALQSSIHPRAIQGMAMREWICRHYGSIRYGTWITHKVGNKEATQGTLCCWKAKGKGNALSAHLRSVPFPLVLSYYKTMQQLHPGSALIDISDWKSEEITILQKLGVQCLNPRVMGLHGLIQTCRNKKIITIDTALAHLCAVMGSTATLLLNHIPDERWRELHQEQPLLRQIFNYS